ncbi:MAG: hypothetical protein DRK00_03790 [Thermoprotei archaeon]|nr:MAG: hypothetical protein DRK00_03790 [Thermoprotei archaeon]
MRRYVALGLLAALLAAAAIASLMTNASPRRAELRVLNATVTSITPTGLMIEGVEGELTARGKWIVVADAVRLCNWSVASGYIGEGHALMAMAAIEEGNSTRYVLLALKQGGVTLFRPLLLKHAALAHKHVRTYVSLRGELVSKGGNYMVLERAGRRVLALVRGRWIKAGAGEVTWGDVQGDFKPGDEVRVFCHHVLVFKPWFSKIFGIDALIWGYSGAIIDLTSGTTISRA